MTRCASELALEAHLFDPTRSRIAPHLEGCGTCRSRLARMEREGDEFRRFVHPRTIDRVLARRSPARGRWGRLAATLIPAGGLVAAAAAMLLLAPRPSDDYLGAKGAALSVHAYAATADGARELSDGDRVPAAALLRFRVATPAPCGLWLVSVDAQGEISRLYPSEGDLPAEVKGGAALPGGVALDGLPGPERLYAVCTPEPVPFARIERSVRDAVAGGESGLRSGPPLSGLPAGATQCTLLVEKVP